MDNIIIWFLGFVPIFLFMMWGFVGDAKDDAAVGDPIIVSWGDIVLSILVSSFSWVLIFIAFLVIGIVAFYEAFLQHIEAGIKIGTKRQKNENLPTRNED